MDTKKSIRQLVEEVLVELKNQGYSPNTVEGYNASYVGLLSYADDNGINEYSEAVGLDTTWIFNLGLNWKVFLARCPGM